MAISGFKKHTELKSNEQSDNPDLETPVMSAVVMRPKWFEAPHRPPPRRWVVGRFMSMAQRAPLIRTPSVPEWPPSLQSPMKIDQVVAHPKFTGAVSVHGDRAGEAEGARHVQRDARRPELVARRRNVDGAHVPRREGGPQGKVCANHLRVRRLGGGATIASTTAAASGGQGPREHVLHVGACQTDGRQEEHKEEEAGRHPFSGRWMQSAVLSRRCPRACTSEALRQWALRLGGRSDCTPEPGPTEEFVNVPLFCCWWCVCVCGGGEWPFVQTWSVSPAGTDAPLRVTMQQQQDGEKMKGWGEQRCPHPRVGGDCEHEGSGGQAPRRRSRHWETGDCAAERGAGWRITAWSDEVAAHVRRFSLRPQARKRGSQDHLPRPAGQGTRWKAGDAT